MGNFVGSCSCCQHSHATSSAFLLPLPASEQPSPAFLHFFVFFFLLFPSPSFPYPFFFCSSLFFSWATSLGLLLAGAPTLAKNVSRSSSSSSSPVALPSEAEGMQFSIEAFFGFVPSHIWSKKVSSSCPGWTLLIAFESALRCSSVVLPVPWFLTVCLRFLPMLTFSATFKNCQIFKPFFQASGSFLIWMSPALTLCCPSSSPYSSVIFFQETQAKSLFSSHPCSAVSSVVIWLSCKPPFKKASRKFCFFSWLLRLQFCSTQMPLLVCVCFP